MAAELCAGVKQVYKLASRLMGVATQAAGEGEPR